MAFRVTCDVKTCGETVQEAPEGQPTLSGKRHVYCDRCAGYIAAVDQEMLRVINLRSLELANELDALRQSKIAQALPQQKGGTGATGEYQVTQC